MRILHCIRLNNKIFFFIIVLSVAKTEQRTARRIDDGGAMMETASVEDVTQSFDFMKSISYLRSSVPMQIYECITTQSLLRCMKMYVLQKMEAHREYPRTGNLTQDFLDKFLTNEKELNRLNLERYAKLSDQELSKRLIFNFQQFFKNSDIKLHFLPGIMVKIVPSKDNKLKFSFKKKLKHRETFTGRAEKTDEEIDENVSVEAAVTNIESGPVGDVKLPTMKKHKNKKEGYSYKNAIIQMAVPIMIMPAILLGSILPFMLPVLKMATIMTLLMNNSAFIAALIYAARTHANAQDEHHISYGSHSIYH